LCIKLVIETSLILEADMEKLESQWYPATYEWHISTKAHNQRLNTCIYKVWGFHGCEDSYCGLTGVM